MEPATPGAQVDIILAYSFNQKEEPFRESYGYSSKGKSTGIESPDDITGFPTRHGGVLVTGVCSRPR